MAQAARKIDPNLKPLSDSLNSSLASETARVSGKLANSLGGSRLAGDGFKKINDKIQDIGEQMAQVIANEVTGQELLKDAGLLALVNAANELNNEAIKKNAADSIKKGAENIDPNEAINNFGNSPLPEESSVAEQIAEHEAKQAALANALQNSQAANDNAEAPTAGTKQSENQPVQPLGHPQAEADQARKEALKPEALDKAQAANDNVESDTKPGAIDNPLPTAPPPEATPPSSAGPTPDSQSKSEASQPPSTQENNNTAPEESSPKEPQPEPKPIEPAKPQEKPEPEPKPEEKTEEKKPEPQPQETPSEEPTAEPEPETNPIDKALNDAGLPLVDPDEDNPMLPKKTEIEKAAEHAKQKEADNSTQPQNGTAQPEPEGENPEDPTTPPQPGQERGKMTQGINALRNRKKISEIEKEIKELEPKLKELKKEIQKINDKIKPIERKITMLRIAYWSLYIVEIFLRLLAGILAITIVFLIFFPLAEMVWAAASIPQTARLALGKEIETLKKEIKEEKDKRDKKEKELKKYQNEIKNLAIQRYNLMNQSLLSRGDPNTPAQP